MQIAPVEWGRIRDQVKSHFTKHRRGETSEELVRAAYGSNYARPGEIKKKYAPKNVRRLHPNIRPDSASNN